MFFTFITKYNVNGWNNKLVIDATNNKYNYGSFITIDNTNAITVTSKDYKKLLQDMKNNYEYDENLRSF